MPWEAIRVLKEQGSRGGYSNYAYWEGDINVPGATFDFWQRHVEKLHAHGFLLLPHRRQMSANKTEVLTNSLLAESCGHPVRFRSQVYFQANNPYTAGFLMNQVQFQEYLHSPRSHYSRDGNPWGVREMAASGLTWDSKYGAKKVLTHTDMPVYHEFPVHDPTSKFIDQDGPYPVSEMEKMVMDCLTTRACDQLPAE
jgi:hypothetical protein